MIEGPDLGPDFMVMASNTVKACVATLLSPMIGQPNNHVDEQLSTIDHQFF